MISVDYGHLGELEAASPILFGKDATHRWYFAVIMLFKGVVPSWGAKALVAQVKTGGHPRVILRSDGEPAVVALKDKVAAVLRKDHGIDVVVEASARGDHQGDGAAEHAVMY